MDDTDSNATTSYYTPLTLVPALPAGEIVQTEKDEKIRAVLGISCCLSIIGSFLIILSYVVQKNRSKVREILVHISVMDLGVSLSNLIGLSVYFNRFYYEGDTQKFVEPAAHIRGMCKTQAFFAAYCTLGSIFWTTALAGYLYVYIMCRSNPKCALYFLRFCRVFCYALAIMISLWLVLIGRLDFSPYDSSGWCTLVVKDPVTEQSNYFILVFAHDLWMYLAVILIVIIYVALKSFLSNELKILKDEKQDTIARQYWASMNVVDYKFILIPILFVLLKMWTLILTVITEYANVDLVMKSPVIYTILVYLAGIGDSLQGFTNAILFIAFTKSARESFIMIVCCRCCHRGRRSDDQLPIFGETPSNFDQHVQNAGSESALYGSTEIQHSLFQSTGSYNSKHKTTAAAPAAI